MIAVVAVGKRERSDVYYLVSDRGSSEAGFGRTCIYIKNPRVVSSGTVLKLAQIMFPTYRLQRYAAPSGTELNVLSVYCKQHKKAQRELRG